MNIQPPDNSRRWLPRLWTWMDILLISFCTVAIILLGTWLFMEITRPSSQQPRITMGYVVLLTSLEVVAILVSIYIFGLVLNRRRWEVVGFVPTSNRWLLLAMGAALFLIPIVGLIALGIQLALGLPTENPQLEFLVPTNISWAGGMAMILLGGFLVPIAEEAFFRGVLYRWMRQFSSPWLAIPVTSAIFGMLHGDIALAGATFVMGMVLAWFYERSRSLWPSITIHVLNNGLKLALLYGLLASGAKLPPGL